MLFKDELNRVLHEDRWRKANQRLLAKMLSEYMYEDIIQPVLIGKENGISHYELETSEHKAYRFSAKPRLFDSFDTVPETIEVLKDGQWTKHVSAIEFLLDIQPHIPMSPETAGHLIKEFNHTLLADVHLLAKDALTADELTEADYAMIEGEMTGHPWIVYNKGGSALAMMTISGLPLNNREPSGSCGSPFIKKRQHSTRLKGWNMKH